MITLFVLMALTLQDVAKTIHDHPAFTAHFAQTLTPPAGDVLKDGGTVRFAWGKGLRFDYDNKEKRSYVFQPKGYSSRTGTGKWDFQAWNESSPELGPFLFLLNGKIPEGTGWTVAMKDGKMVVESAAPAFTLTLDPATGWPQTLSVKQQDGSVNVLEFTGIKRGAEGILP
jgi:hypothetical protein